jgi:hypothetical protein
MTNEVLRAFTDSLNKAHLEANKPIYQKKCIYGKYRISKTGWVDGALVTTWIAKGLTAAQAEGMMKLLKEEE